MREHAGVIIHLNEDYFYDFYFLYQKSSHGFLTSSHLRSQNQFENHRSSSFLLQIFIFSLYLYLSFLPVHLSESHTLFELTDLKILNFLHCRCKISTHNFF